jgi:hypothetical protein
VVAYPVARVIHGVGNGVLLVVVMAAATSLSQMLVGCVHVMAQPVSRVIDGV